MPIRAASRAAAVRDETPILDRTAKTWWCSVRAEMTSPASWGLPVTQLSSVRSARACVIRAPVPARSVDPRVWTPECFSPQHARKGVAKDG